MVCNARVTLPHRVSTTPPTTTQPTLSTEIAGTAHKHFVCIAGNIGVGKTTVTHLLESALGFRAFPEPVDDNPYLPYVYGDMHAWSYKLQRYFLLARSIANERIAMAPHSVIQDRSIYEDMEVFATLQARRGYFTPAQIERYHAFCALLDDELVPPDLLVFLRCSLPTLRERIARRNREYELELLKPGNTYLTDLQELYDRWIASYRRGPTLIIETEQFNFADNLAHASALIERVQAALARRDRVSAVLHARATV